MLNQCYYDQSAADVLAFHVRDCLLLQQPCIDGATSGHDCLPLCADASSNMARAFLGHVNARTNRMHETEQQRSCGRQPLIG